MTLRCTTNQMELQLDHPDSPYIRAIGFLYLRFVGEPQSVYQWIEQYLYDEEPIHVTVNSQKKSHHQQQQQSHRHGRRQGGLSDPETIGDFVRKLFSEREYYGVMLPRFPIHIERDIQVKLLLAEKNQRRAQKHLADEETMSYFQRVGAQVMALYGDEENPIQWYEAVVDRVITRNEETSRPLKVPKFVVTFPEYGNTETVSLGDLEHRGVPLDAVSSTSVPSSSADPSDHGDGRRGDGRRYGDSSNYGGGRADLYDEVRRREQERVTAKGKNAIARRPPSAKASLAAPITASTRRSEYGYDDRRSPTGRLAHEEMKTSSSTPEVAELLPDVAPLRERKHTTEEIAAIQEKKRKLMAKYG
jgi:pre-mRNA-splicing factor 38B